MPEPKERRKHYRKKVDSKTSIEIKHSFGSKKKSVFDVREFDDFGLSFYIPLSEGYFSPGTPLNFTLTQSNLQKREDSVGIVRWYDRYDDDTGKSYYIVGLEIDPLSRGISVKKDYKLRPKRYTPKGKKQFVKCAIANKEYEFELADISNYSAAFFIPSDLAIDLRISMLLADLKVVIKGQTIFDGSATVTRLYHDKDKLTKVVISPRKKIFNVDAIEEHDALSSMGLRLDDLIRKHQLYQKLDEQFKALIGDMKVFLEEYKLFVESSYVSALYNANHGKTRHIIHSKFFKPMDNYVSKLHDIVHSLNLKEEDKHIYRSYIQSQLHPIVMVSPFWHRIYFKPLGYAGDFEMMKMLKDNEYSGSNLFAKILHKQAMLSLPGKANRNRIDYLSDKLIKLVGEIKDPVVDILSVACGPALEIERLVKKNPKVSNRINLTLLDQEIKALEFSQKHIYESRIKYNSSMKVNFIHEPIGSFFKRMLKKEVDGPKYHIIYVFGLFDYFDDKVAKKFLKHITKYIREDGVLLISNYSLDNNKYDVYLEYGFEWDMIYRDKKEMAELTSAIKNTKSFKVEEEKTRNIKFLEVKV